MTPGGAVRRSSAPAAADDASRAGSAAGAQCDATEWLRAAHCLALDAFTARTASVLRRAGIPRLLLKGPATAHRLYPDLPDQRTYTDVDLLVPPDRFDEAEGVLARSGYTSMLLGVRPGEFPWHETAWAATDSPVLHLDLHRGFAGVGDAAAFFAQLWETRDLLAVGGHLVDVPSAAGTALILALHAASPGRSRTPLIDVRRAGEVFNRSTWREAATMARACGAESACRAGLELLPGGVDLADSIGLAEIVSPDQWLAGRQFDRVSVNLAALLSHKGIAARTRVLVARLLPSPAFVRLWDVPARRGRLALAGAYGRRLRRAVLAAPRAVADVRLATRASREARRRVRVRRARRALVWLLRGDQRSISTAWWAVRVHRRARQQLAVGGVGGLDLCAPSASRDSDRRAVVAVLRARRATCLERSVVLQRFDAAAGRPREVIIAVTAPGDTFRAHAWLDGDRPPGRDFHEIIRHAPQPLWLDDPVRVRG